MSTVLLQYSVKRNAYMIAEKCISSFYMSPYLLDVPVIKYLFFSQSKRGNKFNSFDPEEDIKAYRIAELGRLPKRNFHLFFSEMAMAQNKCLCLDGAYFEDDKQICT